MVGQRLGLKIGSGITVCLLMGIAFLPHPTSVTVSIVLLGGFAFIGIVSMYNHIRIRFWPQSYADGQSIDRVVAEISENLISVLDRSDLYPALTRPLFSALKPSAIWSIQDDTFIQHFPDPMVSPKKIGTDVSSEWLNSLQSPQNSHQISNTLRERLSDEILPSAIIVPLYSRFRFEAALIINIPPRNNFHYEKTHHLLNAIQELASVIFDRIRPYETMKMDYTKTLQEKSALEALFAVSITLNHEVNNPLTSIKVIGQLLKTGTPINPSNQQKWADLIIHNTQRIADVMTKLSSISEVKTTEYVGGVAMIDLGCAPMSETSRVNSPKPDPESRS